MTGKKQQNSNSDGVLAGGQFPEAMRAPTHGIESPSRDELSLHLQRLKALHPNLKVNFRAQDLAQMTAEEKRMLIEDCYQVLGIAPAHPNDR